MIEAKDRAMQFENELKTFLKKWNTKIELEGIGRDWSSEYGMKCYIDAIYKDGNCIAEFTEVNLGSYISPDCEYVGGISLEGDYLTGRELELKTNVKPNQKRTYNHRPANFG